MVIMKKAMIDVTEAKLLFRAIIRLVDTKHVARLKMTILAAGSVTTKTHFMISFIKLFNNIFKRDVARQFTNYTVHKREINYVHSLEMYLFLYVEVTYEWQKMHWSKMFAQCQLIYPETIV